jgi:hypothetical protein
MTTTVVSTLERCRSLSEAEITAVVREGGGVGDLCVELGRLWGRRTDPSLPGAPLLVRHRFLGDASVHDVTVAVDGTDPGGSGAADLTVEWAHWQDAVRVANGETVPSALRAAHRLSLVAPDDTTGLAWLGAVDFDGSGGAAPGSLVSRLRSTQRARPDQGGDVVAAHGVDGLLLAGLWERALGLAEVAGEDLRDIGVAWSVDAGDPVAVAVFDRRGRATVELIARVDLPAAIDLVEVEYASPEVLVGVLGGTILPIDAIVNGMIQLLGEPNAVRRFVAVFQRLAL